MTFNKGVHRKFRLKSQNTMDQVENTRRIVDEDLRLIFHYSKRVISGQVKNGELINYDVPDWNALVSLAYFFMIVSTGLGSSTIYSAVRLPLMRGSLLQVVFMRL